MQLSKFSVRKPITIIMAVLIVAILGVISLLSLETDLFPSMNMPYALVQTAYPGASPEEVEMIVTKHIEGVMATVNNIKNIQSVSRENASLVILEFNESTSMDSAMIEMRENLDMILDYMPDEVSRPVIMKINPDMMPVMNFSISVAGMNLTEASHFIREAVLPRIERLEGVATLSLMGSAKNEVHVTLDEDKIKKENQRIVDHMKQVMMEKMGMPASTIQSQPALPLQPQPKETETDNQDILTKDMVTGILAGQNFSMPSGYLLDDKTEHLVRIGDEVKDVDAIANLAVFSQDDITIKLSDIATVEMVDTADKAYTRVNGEQAIMVSVQKQNNYATTDVIKRINEEITAIESDQPEVAIVPIMDQGKYINLAVGSVSNNLIYGGILAILILAIFLRDLKPTFVVAVAIPISVLAALILIFFMNITLNIVSMGGLALGIGMLVDNSIVVIENIYRLRAKGLDTKEAAVKGARQVAGAITASTLTTISVFLPVVFLEGLTAQIFKEMAITISCSLVASLLIALTFVPMAASGLLKGPFVKKERKGLKRTKKAYENFLEWSLHHKTVVMIVTLVIFLASIFGSLQLGTDFFPESDTGQINVEVSMPKGTQFDTMADMLNRVATITMDIDGVDTVGATIGGNIFSSMSGEGSADSGYLYVLIAEDSRRKTVAVAQDIRDQTADLDCEITVQNQAMDPSAFMNVGISVEVRGNDLAILEGVAKDISDMVQSAEGTAEVDNGINKTSPEIKITVDKDKAIKEGLTVAQVYMAVNRAIDPKQKVSTLTMDARKYDIFVFERTEEDMDMEALENLEIQTATGGTAILKDVASIKKQSGYSTINRTNQERTLTVTASLQEGYNIGLVGSSIQEKLDGYTFPKGYSAKLIGENEQIGNAFDDLLYAMILSVVLIYMIMAAQFQSLRYPFIVMFTIPLAFTGGFLALLITTTPISIVAFIGMIILTGVVVNNGIVLVDYTNQLKADGMDTHSAVIKAGKTRLRPIIMTALTTIFALSTMSIGVGRGAEMMQPMAITAIGGLIFATVLTLIVVPVMYSAFDHAQDRRRNRRDKRKKDSAITIKEAYKDKGHPKPYKG